MRAYKVAGRAARSSRSETTAKSAETRVRLHLFGSCRHGAVFKRPTTEYIARLDMADSTCIPAVVAQEDWLAKPGKFRSCRSKQSPSIFLNSQRKFIMFPAICHGPAVECCFCRHGVSGSLLPLWPSRLRAAVSLFVYLSSVRATGLCGSCHRPAYVVPAPVYYPPVPTNYHPVRHGVYSHTVHWNYHCCY